MLGADLTPRVLNLAFQQAESGFFGRLAQIDHVDFSLDNLPLHYAIDYFYLNVCGHVIPDVFGQPARAHIAGAEKPWIAVVLADSDQNLVPRDGSALGAALAPAARMAFLNPHRAFQLFRIGFSQRFADAMTQIPSGLVADSQDLLNLIGGDSLLRSRHQLRYQEPGRKWQMRIVEDRAHGRGKLIAAAIADEHLAIRDQVGRDFIRVATQAPNPFGPAKTRYDFAAPLVVAIPFNSGHQCWEQFSQRKCKCDALEGAIEAADTS